MTAREASVLQRALDERDRAWKACREANERAVVLTQQLRAEQARASLRVRKGRRGHCHYCGDPSPRGRACRAHADLLALDVVA